MGGAEAVAGVLVDGERLPASVSWYRMAASSASRSTYWYASVARAWSPSRSWTLPSEFRASARTRAFALSSTIRQARVAVSRATSSRPASRWMGMASL